MIYRLHEAGRNGNPGPTNIQGNPIPITTLSSSAVITADHLHGDRHRLLRGLPGVRQGHRGCCSATPTCSASSGSCSSRCPRSCRPASAAWPGTGAKIQIAIGGLLQHPAGGVRQAALAASFASYLVANARSPVAADREAGARSSTCPGAATSAPSRSVWAVAMLLLVFESDIGTSAVFMGMFVAMIYIATVADLVAAHRVHRVRRRRVRRRRAVFPRAHPVQRLAAPVQHAEPDRRHPARVPDRAGPVRDGQRRPARPRSRQRPAVLHAAGAERLHLHRASARSSAWPG